jgi:glycolate oxidase iron-sulfur subunit
VRTQALGGAFDEQHPPDPARIDACVHCGFCLPTCPTYALWQEEMDSPRGRIYLMKSAHEGRAELSPAFVRHFDTCLGCLACVTACPSGVEYGPLIEATRGQIERRHTRTFGDRLFREGIFRLFPYRSRMRIALLPLVPLRPVLDALRRTRALALLPARLRAMLELAPRVSVRGLFSTTPERTPAAAPRRATVGLLTGCVQQVALPEVNAATARVLAAEGAEVVAPAAQGCCGALALHVGRLEQAQAFARRTIAVFERANVDAVVVNAAGCGSAMKEYGELLASDAAWAARARAFSARVRDVHELLAEWGPRAERHPLPLRVVYQDACHLAHGQNIRAQPRELLRAIPGLTLVDIAEPEMCCGSAGVYNLTEPDTARELGDRKVRHIAAARPDVIASGNPGCTLQIAAAAAREGHAWRVVHPVELLDASLTNTTAEAVLRRP